MTNLNDSKRREIKRALAEKKIIIDPAPQKEQYSTSAVDLYLGDEILELKTPDQLRAEEPVGVERPIVIDPTRIVVKDLLRKYAKSVQFESDGSFIFEPRKFRTWHHTGIYRTQPPN